MKHKAFIYSLLIPFTFALFSCDKDNPDAIAERDRKKILEYIAEHDLDARELDEGVFIVITKEGTGGKPKEHNLVLVTYTGYLLNGDIYSQRTDFQTPFSNLVRGFRIGLLELNRDSEATIIIPSAAGYGLFSFSNVPKNSVLLYDVTLHDF